MDQTELHYLTYDPDEIFREMHTAYMEAGGDVMYPGDEKDMLLRAVQAVMVQAFAGVDNALRMSTLRYASGEYLDVYGENRNCERYQAVAATANIRIIFAQYQASGTIYAGTTLTADGQRLYRLTEDIVYAGYAAEMNAGIEALIPGASGNALQAGMQMQFVVPQNGVVNVVCTTGAVNGRDVEDDEAYRERIRLHGLVGSTTGSKERYETVARQVSVDIVDVAARNAGAGVVEVVLLLNDVSHDDAGVAATIVQNVLAALDSASVRPLTDEVRVKEAGVVPYLLEVSCTTDGSSNVTAAIENAANEYKAWQEQKIGRGYDPYRLMAAMYQAGASHVVFTNNCWFGTGETPGAAYTPIGEDERCKGTVRIVTSEQG